MVVFRSLVVRILLVPQTKHFDIRHKIALDVLCLTIGMIVECMKIKLNDTVTMDLSKLIESRLLVQANSGGGKSWAIRRIIEQAFGHVQIIVIDPEGEFGNLRGAYDFVYVGKDGDAATEPRSAALLARRLLELKASSIIDLYELPPQERKHFVKIFCDSLVNAPKELWHDVLVIIDEAHVFAPEKGESEALGAVIDLASRGRKRGFCAILATQRPAKLNKDAAAECNNKLVGRASLDIDRKRSGEELGFSSREQLLSLRDLEPGEFYAFGPAISRDIQKVTIGNVVVAPPKRGVSRAKPPAPSSAVKKILAQLADLPQAALEETNTIIGLKTELTLAKRKIVELEKTPRFHNDSPESKALAERVLKNAQMRWQSDQKVRDDAWARLVKEWKAYAKDIKIKFPETSPANEPKELNVSSMFEGRGTPLSGLNFPDSTKRTPIVEAFLSTTEAQVSLPSISNERAPLSKGARDVLTYLHSRYPHWKPKAQCWIATGYAPSGGFNNIMYEVTGAGYVEKDGSGAYAAVQNAYSESLLNERFDSHIEKWDTKLSIGARKVFRILIDASHLTFSKGDLAQMTGYARGGGFNNIIYELTGKQLAIKVGVSYQFNPEILDL